MLFFVPIGTSAKLRRTPIATYIFIGINVLVYFLELVVFFSGDSNALRELFYTFGFVPSEPRWHALFTSMFVHDAPLPFHIAGNMIYLWIFGRHIEDALGSVVYAVFYMTSQFGAIFMQVVALRLLNPRWLSIPQVGASGAIAALLGLFAIRFYHERIELFYACGPVAYFRHGTTQLPSLLVLGVWFALEILNGLLSSAGTGGAMIAHWAHVGGFLVGVIAAFSFGSLKDAQVESLTSHAEWLLRCGMRQAAMKYLKRAVRADPTNAVARLLLAVSSAKSEGDNVATAHLQAALRYGAHSASGVSLIAEAIASLPEELRVELTRIGTPKMRLEMAVLLERSRNYDAALELFKSVASDERADDEHRALAAIRSADILFRHCGNREGARRMLKWLCERFPSSHWVDLARHMLRQIGME